MEAINKGAVHQLYMSNERGASPPRGQRDFRRDLFNFKVKESWAINDPGGWRGIGKRSERAGKHWFQLRHMECRVDPTLLGNFNLTAIGLTQSLEECVKKITQLSDLDCIPAKESDGGQRLVGYCQQSGAEQRGCPSKPYGIGRGGYRLRAPLNYYPGMGTQADKPKTTQKETNLWQKSHKMNYLGELVNSVENDCVTSIDWQTRDEIKSNV